jgi:hypothetical protein
MEKAILKARKKSENKTRTCMFEDCQNIAIKSHILQKNGILNEISEKNHLIGLVPSNPFEMETKGISDFKTIGINNAYTFQGFCKSHDSNIFKPIETNFLLDFNNKYHQTLFCYRGLCQEIRRKEISIEWLDDLRDFYPPEILVNVFYLTEGYYDGIKNLKYFKTELENCIKSNNYDTFHFDKITIPRIDLCISTPLNIRELEIPKYDNSDSMKKFRKTPFTTSFLNIFPKGNNSIIIAGYHKKYPCAWTNDFIRKINNGTEQNILKELSDLITLRLEFWAMSPSLFNSIDRTELEKYKKQFKENVYNHSAKLETELNLFKKT